MNAVLVACLVRGFVAQADMNQSPGAGREAEAKAVTSSAAEVVRSLPLFWRTDILDSALPASERLNIDARTVGTSSQASRSPLGPSVSSSTVSAVDPVAAPASAGRDEGRRLHSRPSSGRKKLRKPPRSAAARRKSTKRWDDLPPSLKVEPLPSEIRPPRWPPEWPRDVPVQRGSASKSRRRTPKLLVPKVQSDGFGRVFWGASWALLALLVMWGAQQAQERLASRGLLPFFVRQVRWVSVGLAILFGLWGGFSLLPQVPSEVVWGALAAVVLLLLVAARGLLPDVLAGMLILSERRIGEGMQVEGEGFAGTVVGTGWRCTLLRTPRGLLELPNRKLLAGPLRTAGESEHELILWLRPGLPADTTRRHIEDVVIASAWTPPDPRLRVHRDPRNPHRWAIHTRLLDPRYAPTFDAELPERLERRLVRPEARSEAVAPDLDASALLE